MRFKELKMDNDMKELEKFDFNFIGKSIIGKLLKYKENKKFKGRWFIILDDNDVTNKIINCPTDLKKQINYFLKKEPIHNDLKKQIGDIIKIEYTEDIKKNKIIKKGVNSC